MDTLSDADTALCNTGRFYIFSPMRKEKSTFVTTEREREREKSERAAEPKIVKHVRKKLKLHLRGGKT